ncbi:Variant-specific surface protein [Giardia duodenalis]|uniref:Variant-specific surface protein n=1 Tax=Giardia intestinalis TaxID=5741 RepID=V6TN33_GIAIN|nr:Variant-specific surface protein [Giardia intestinalis]
MHLSRARQPEVGMGAAASPGSQTRVPGTPGVRVACTGRGSRSRRSGQGRLGCTRMGHSCMLIVRDGRCYCSCSWSAPVLCGALPARGGCYDISVAGSGVCREIRDRACVMYAEENKTDKTSARVGATSTEDTCPKVSDSSQVTGKCAQNKCDVTIGGSQYCSQCSEPSDHLVDGKCVAAGEDTANACTAKTRAADGTCASCAKGYFLHRGGCYKIGQAPGNAICTDTQASSTVGECTTCAAGYFKNPTAAGATVPPCIACNDTTGDSTNMGKAGCATCEPPKSSGVAKCTACLGGFFGTGSGDITCTACTDPCKTCKGANNKCTSCNEGNTPYFKEGTNGDGTGTCVAEGGCGNTHFPVAADKKCYPCSNTDKGGIANCQACTMSGNTITCDTCAEGKKPNTAKTTCVPCNIEGCTSCDKENVCAVCDNDKYLAPTGQCVDSCDKLGGYYADSNVCKPCDPSCASCSTAGNNKCLSCPAGKVLKYTSESSPTDGSCVDECKTGAGGCADCGATIGGSKYCSRCSDTNQAPLNGNCAANTARTKFCTNASNGACTQCANGYFLLDGGCYQTSRQPGIQICTTADNNGQCQTCANGQNANAGKCPVCAEGCAKCQSSTSTCTECLAGYYLSNSKCVKCSENSADGNIKGVPNCVSCVAPTTSGPVTCYVTQEPAVDPTDPSVNKGGLSSGAIAGISVAVIAVAGGLVGLLCWWFVCRGKA